MPDRLSFINLAKSIPYLKQIKKWIELEEIDEIDEEIEALQELSSAEDVRHIIHLLQLGLYQASIPAIDECIARFGSMFQEFINSHMGIVWRKRSS